MIELIEFAWRPFCIVQRRILEYSGIRFKGVPIPYSDRSLVWRLTRQRYYQVPVLRDGRNVLFEMDDTSQVLAKYLDDKLQLGLFPRELEGEQSLIWRNIENEVEGLAFRLNDIYWQEFVPPAEQLGFLRHKERKFGRGCLEQWKAQRKQLLQELTARLLPFEEMFYGKQFLLENRPRFVDFDLFGMLSNFLYSGHYSLPAAHRQLKDCYQRMKTLQIGVVAGEDDEVPF